MIYHTLGEHANHYTTDAVLTNREDIKDKAKMIIL
jgi:hypothetical protein